MSELAGNLSGAWFGGRWVLRRRTRRSTGYAVLSMSAEPPAGGAGAASGPASSDAAASGGGNSLEWTRVELDYVAAYILVRGSEVAIVDTGIPDSADTIERVLRETGSDWSAVRHVVLTHKHEDHAGSLPDVLARAASAQAYVGAADLREVDSPRELRAVGDDDEVFGMRIIETPGHTPGHVSVFDSGTGLLVAGDALTHYGTLTGSAPEYTDDEALAAESVRKLAPLRPTTILFGHGDPLLDGASAALEELAASLA